MIKFSSDTSSIAAGFDKINKVATKSIAKTMAKKRVALSFDDAESIPLATKNTLQIVVSGQNLSEAMYSDATIEDILLAEAKDIQKDVVDTLIRDLKGALR